MAGTKKKTPAKKASPKKASTKKVTAKVTKKAAKVKTKAAPVVTKDELKDLDRKGLAARARQLKTELLAIRFNVASPSLQDYRKKRRALAAVLSALR